LVCRVFGLPPGSFVLRSYIETLKSHDNITQFYEWYETSNHLWLVIELCTGGSLEQVIKQDLELPLTEIRKIGADLARGLCALQKSEICVGDLSPGRCLFDGPGVLKINNLSCAHYENEEIDSVYQSGNVQNRHTVWPIRLHNYFETN